MSALIAEAVGMVALVVADDPVMIMFFAFGEGIGFGLCLYATTVLLVNYFGVANNPPILGTMHVITTVAMIGPVLGGYVADTFGGFSLIFQCYAFIVLAIAVVVALMRPPGHKEVTAPEATPAE